MPTLEVMSDNPFLGSDYKSVLSSKKFHNILQQRASLCMISNHETSVLITKAQEIIALIDEELDQ